MLREVFDVPDLAMMDDSIVNGTYDLPADRPAPLAMFTARGFDYSLHRLKHYTPRRSSEHFPELRCLFHQLSVSKHLGTVHAATRKDLMADWRLRLTSASSSRARWCSEQAGVDPSGPTGTPIPRMPADARLPPQAGELTAASPCQHRASARGQSAQNVTPTHVAVLRTARSWLILGPLRGPEDTAK